MLQPASTHTYLHIATNTHSRHKYLLTHTHTHTGFQNPHAFGCRVLRGELPAARVVLSNNTLKWREPGRGAKRGEEKKKSKVLNMYFEPNVAGQASRHDGTTCMDNRLLTGVRAHAPKNTYIPTTDTHPHTHNVRLKEMMTVLIWAANGLCSALWGYKKTEI